MFLEFVLILCLVFYIVKTYNKNKWMPPGPFPLPFIGNLHQIGFDPPFTLNKLCELYGDVYRVTLPVGTFVIVNSAYLTREALVIKKDDFSGRPKEIMYPVNVILEEDIASAEYGETLIFRRKVLRSALRGFCTTFAKGSRNDAVGEILQLISDTEGKPFSLRSYVLSAVVGDLWRKVSSTKCCFGDPTLKSLVGLVENVSFLSSQGNLYQLLPFLRHFTTQYTSILGETIKARNEILGSIIENHRHSYRKGKIRDITDALLEAYTTDEIEELSNSNNSNAAVEIMNIVMNILFGGSSTITAVVTWFALYVALDCDLQSKLQRELDQAIGRERLPDWQDVEKLPYLQSTVCEVMRHSPFMPFLIPHKTTCATTIKGYHLPKNTPVLFNLYRIYRDPAEWHQPTLFKPERFLDIDGEFLGWSKILAFMPFGLGTRSCPGKDFGKIQTMVIASCLLHQFTIKIAEQENTPTLKDSVAGAIRYPKDYKLVARKRSHQLKSEQEQ